MDGVINANQPRWGSQPRRSSAWAYGQRWTLKWAPALVQQMAGWHRAGAVELRWSTTWCPFADQLESLWGFPRLERCLTEVEVATKEASTTAKVAAALAVLEVEGRHLIWTDDDAIPQDRATQRRLSPGHPASLLISPQPNRGLTKEHVVRIREFLESVQDR